MTIRPLSRTWLIDLATIFVLGAAASCQQGKPGPIGNAGPRGDAGPAGTSGTVGGPGVQGPPASNHVTWIRTTVAAAGPDAGMPNTVDVGTWGPFTLSGYCFAAAPYTAEARFFIRSTEIGSKITDYHTAGENRLLDPSTGPVAIEYLARSTSSATSDLEGPYDGTFAGLAADAGVYITGALTTGVYMAGPSGPACQFAGFVNRSP